MKFSWMHLSLMKALCALEMSLSMYAANRIDSTFVSSFAKEWIRLIGQKSFGSDAISVFGSSTTWARLRCSKAPEWCM